MPPPAIRSRIHAVTVFHAGALVTRAADIARDNGAFPDAVRLSNLPLSLDDGSLRVRVEADGRPPLATDLRVALEVPEIDASLPPAEDTDLRAARQVVVRLRDQADHVRLLISRFDQFAFPGREREKENDVPGPIPTRARQALLNLRVEQLKALYAEMSDIDFQIKRAEEIRQDLESKFNRATSARQPREKEMRKSVIISLRDEGEIAPSARLLVDYFVPGARWAPAYTFKFTRDFTRAHLAMRAMVSQNSGEDWTGVQVTLSTADAQRWTELPELTSIRIGRRQPRPEKTGWRPPPTGAEALYADYDRAVKAHEPKMRGGDSPARRYNFVGFDQASKAFGISMSEWDELSQLDIRQRRGPDNEVQFLMRDLVQHRPELFTKHSIRGLDLGVDDASETRVGGAIMPLDEALAQAKSAPPPPPMPPSQPVPMGLPQMSRVQAAVRPSTSGGKARAAATAETESTVLPVPPEPEPELASAAMLNYGRLRLAGPHRPSRGKPLPASQNDLYLELLAQLNVTVSFNVQAVVSHAVNTAREVEHAAPPPGHHYPGKIAGFDYAYPAETPVDIPSDREFHSLPLLQREMDAGLRFVSVPRETQDVFRFVNIRNPLESPLPAGPADVYIGGDFLMTVPLPLVWAKSPFNVGLGVEQQVKVARNTAYAEETSGLMGGNLELTHAIAIEVMNHLKQPATVEVRERLPVPRKGDDQVKVIIPFVEPPWQEFRQADRPLEGGYAWTVTVDPGQKKDLKAKYTVQIASKNELAGGNRREN